MPPPPPPSKSYLLVIDDSSDEEEEGESYRIHHQEEAFSIDPTIYSPSYGDEDTSNANRRRSIAIVEEEEEEDYDEDCEELDNNTTDFDEEDESCTQTCSTSLSDGSQKLSKNQKKKRTRRRNKKRSKACGASDTTRRISFSTVSVRSYPRAFSEVAVPSDGGWPLGMELKPLLEGAIDDVTVEEFEAEKQQRLKERWEGLLQSDMLDEKVAKQMTSRSDSSVPLTFETRQWDYRSRMKNPLFGALLEEQRQAIFLETFCEEGGIPAPPKGRPRSNSFTDNNSTSSNSKGGSAPCTKRRIRSTSFSHSENFNEKYNQVYVHHVRNELEKVRIERTTSGATGCNCRKLTVYIPPKGGGGKKAQHRRLKPAKLTSELKKRNLYDESATREELEQILHDAIEKEPCCSSEDCFCHRNGIDCQADACSCWHDSHVHTKSSGRLSIQTIKDRCGNPNGTTIVDNEAIDAYRYHMLESNFCQFIETAQ